MSGSFFSNTNAAVNGGAVTPHDSNFIRADEGPVKSLYIGTTGDLVVVMAGGSQVTFQNVPVGVLPIQVLKVLSTGTSASDIVWLV